MLVITPTFTANFNTSFGANAEAAQAAWRAAAHVFIANFTDNIHINITVDAVGDQSIFGQSNSSAFIPIPYANLRAKMVADAKSPNDSIALGPGGSLTGTDPASGTGHFFLTRSQAKALGVIRDDLLNDGTTTFGAGFRFTFSGPIAPGTSDFHGIAAHEISEVLGRVGFAGNNFSVLDLFSYTAHGKRGLHGGPGNHFSIDNGTTLLKLFNDPTVNHFDSRDWASGTAGTARLSSSASFRVHFPWGVLAIRLSGTHSYGPRGLPMSAASWAWKVYALSEASEGIGELLDGIKN
jgi:hypothetical protein